MLFVYLPQYWNSNQSKFSILCYPNYRNEHKKPFLECTKFCKGSCHLVCSCVFNSWVVVIIIGIFELRKQNCESNSSFGRHNFCPNTYVTGVLANDLEWILKKFCKLTIILVFRTYHKLSSTVCWLDTDFVRFSVYF